MTGSAMPWANGILVETAGTDMVLAVIGIGKFRSTTAVVPNLDVTAMQVAIGFDTVNFIFTREIPTRWGLMQSN